MVGNSVEEKYSERKSEAGKTVYRAISGGKAAGTIVAGYRRTVFLGRGSHCFV
jgi:hypothetical protein